MKWDHINRLVGFLIFIATIMVTPQAVISGRISLILGLIISFAGAIIATFISWRGILSALRKSSSRKMAIWSYALSSLIAVPAVFIMSSKYSSLYFLLVIPVDCLLLYLPIYLKYRENRPPNISNLEFSEKYTSQLKNALSGKAEYIPDVYISDSIRGRRLAYATTGNEFKIVVAKEAEGRLSDSEIETLLVMKFFEKKSNYGKKLVYSIAAYFLFLFDAIFLMMGASRAILTTVQQIYLLVVTFVAVVLIFLTPFVIKGLLMYFEKRQDRYLAENYGHTEDIISLVKKQNEILIPLRPLSEKQYNSYLKRLQKMTKKRIAYLEEFSARSKRI